MRSDLDGNIARGLIISTALRYSAEQLAISADVALAEGMPMALAFDPASTGRNVKLYTPAVSSNNLLLYHKLFNISTGTGQLTVQTPAAATIGVMDPGSSADCYFINGAWSVFIDNGAGAARGNAAKSIIPLYLPLSTLVNTNVLAVAVPFNFTLTSVGFRTKIPVTTGAKLATLTAQIQATPTTGGVISLTSAACTPTNTLVAGTAITALNVGVAGNTVGVLASAVTAFLEGDGYVEFGLTNTT